MYALRDQKVCMCVYLYIKISMVEYLNTNKEYSCVFQSSAGYLKYKTGVLRHKIQFHSFNIIYFYLSLRTLFKTR